MVAVVCMCVGVIGWLVVFYTLETLKAILGRLLTCDCVHIWYVYSAASLGNLATSTKT